MKVLICGNIRQMKIFAHQNLRKICLKYFINIIFGLVKLVVGAKTLYSMIIPVILIMPNYLWVRYTELGIVFL